MKRWLFFILIFIISLILGVYLKNRVVIPETPPTNTVTPSPTPNPTAPPIGNVLAPRGVKFIINQGVKLNLPEAAPEYTVSWKNDAAPLAARFGFETAPRIITGDIQKTYLWGNEANYLSLSIANFPHVVVNMVSDSTEVNIESGVLQIIIKAFGSDSVPFSIKRDGSNGETEYFYYTYNNYPVYLENNNVYSILLTRSKNRISASLSFVLPPDKIIPGQSLRVPNEVEIKSLIESGRSLLYHTSSPQNTTALDIVNSEPYPVYDFKEVRVSSVYLSYIYSAINKSMRPRVAFSATAHGASGMKVADVVYIIN